MLFISVFSLKLNFAEHKFNCVWQVQEYNYLDGQELTVQYIYASIKPNSLPIVKLHGVPLSYWTLLILLIIYTSGWSFMMCYAVVFILHWQTWNLVLQLHCFAFFSSQVQRASPQFLLHQGKSWKEELFVMRDLTFTHLKLSHCCNIHSSQFTTRESSICIWPWRGGNYL